jgi:hypothetical protein
MKSGSLLDVGSIQADFDPAPGVLLSEKIGVPEGTPGELPVLLSGFGVFLIWKKRSSHRAAA